MPCGDTGLQLGQLQEPRRILYGMEVVLPVEIELKSLRIMMEAELPEQEWTSARMEQLALLDEKRMRALYQTQLYQKRVARAFNKKVRPSKIKEGDLVLKQSRPLAMDPGESSGLIGKGHFLLRRSGGMERLA